MFSGAADPGTELLGCGLREDFVGGVGSEFMGPEVGGGEVGLGAVFGGEDLVGSKKGVVWVWEEEGLGLGYDLRLGDDEFCGGEKVGGGGFGGETGVC